MIIGHESISTALGPGKRYVIWVQGCGKRCPDCINPAGWDKNAGYYSGIDSIMQNILVHKDLTGVTISGGEPFDQYIDLKELVKRIHEETSLDIMVYSGYTYKEICEQNHNAHAEIFQYVDIFIDGQYEQDLNTNSMYRGSDNQNIYFFTQKYEKYRNEILHSKNRDFSFEISGNGDVYFIGIPPAGFYAKFLENISTTSV